MRSDLFEPRSISKPISPDIPQTLKRPFGAMMDDRTPEKSLIRLRERARRLPPVLRYMVRRYRSDRILGYVMLTGRFWQWSADGKTYTDESTAGIYRVIPYRRPEYILLRCSVGDA